MILGATMILGSVALIVRLQRSPKAAPEPIPEPA